MSYIPYTYVEAARIDGCNPPQIFLRIIMPLCKPGIAALAMLLFIDNWNMVEQPIILLQDAVKQPLSSFFLSVIGEGERGIRLRGMRHLYDADDPHDAVCGEPSGRRHPTIRN